MRMESDFIRLFESAIKAADTATVKGSLLDQTEASSCINTLSRLKSFPIGRRSLQTNHIEERLNRLTKHKNQKIRFTASLLILLWRHSIRNQGRQASPTLQKPAQKKPSDNDQPREQPQMLSSSPKKPLEVSENLGNVEKSKTIPKNKLELLELLLIAEKEADAAAAKGISLSTASRCVEALNQIERSCWSLAHEAIFTTRIGNRIHSLIHHNNPEIRSAIESLYYGWLKNSLLRAETVTAIPRRSGKQEHEQEEYG